MKFDTVIQTPIANTTASSPEPAPESSVQNDLEKYPLLALISNEYASGEAASPDVPLPAGGALPAVSIGTNPIRPDPTADASPVATSETDPDASTSLSVPDEKTPPAEKEKKEPVDPLEARFWPEDLDIVFEPIRAATPGERAELIQKLSSDVIAAFQAGLISRNEALEELKARGDSLGYWSKLGEA